MFIYSSCIIISKPEGVWFFIKLNVWVCELNWTWLYSISYISMYVCIGIYYFERRGLWQHVSLRWRQGNCQLWEDCFMNQAANLEPLNLRDKYSPYTAVSSVLTTRPASILQKIDWHLQHGSTHCIQMWMVQGTVTTELFTVQWSRFLFVRSMISFIDMFLYHVSKNNWAMWPFLLITPRVTWHEFSTPCFALLPTNQNPC